jgi:membrane protein DedA with SNARE-associated domain
MKMHWRRFLVFNAGGGILWATIYGVGFSYFATVLKTLRAPFDIAIGVAAVLAVIGGLVALRRQEKQLRAAAENAYPGSLD